ncbi:MAG: hypothetical protein ACOYOA_08465 [Saprospiraceae bacterium]
MIFIILYLIATCYYPGGSNFDHSSVRFDWMNNYWCDLTGDTAKNGAANPARPIALLAVAILCISLSVFWYQISGLFTDWIYSSLIRFCGIGSMVGILFLYTSLHDVVIHVSGALGLIAILALIKGLYNNGYLLLFSFGISCIFLMLVNYGIYESGFFLHWLPIVQKATFLLFLTWIILVNLSLFVKKLN